MKKTIKNTNGTEETIEGSPQELVEYENLKKKEKNKEVIKGKQIEEKIVEPWVCPKKYRDVYLDSPSRDDSSKIIFPDPSTIYYRHYDPSTIYYRH